MTKHINVRRITVTPPRKPLWGTRGAGGPSAPATRTVDHLRRRWEGQAVTEGRPSAYREAVTVIEVGPGDSRGTHRPTAQPANVALSVWAPVDNKRCR